MRKYVDYIAKRILTVTNGLFVAFLLIQLLPDREYRLADEPRYTIMLVLILQLLMLAATFLTQKDRLRHVITDITGFVYALLIFWQLATVKLVLINENRQMLFPPPGRVLSQLINDFGMMIENTMDSLVLVFQGYILAVAVAIPLGLFLGWNIRIGSAAGYVSKFFSSISPLVYIPYAIVLLPSFRAASLLVIFAASFWPAMAGTMSGVLNVEKRIIDAAATLCVSKTTMLFRIILPAALPQIFIGLNQGLTVSFILLVSAEMIGGNSGLGFFVNNNATFGNFTRVMVGVIFIGIVVTFIAFLFNLTQRFLLRWKN